MHAVVYASTIRGHRRGHGRVQTFHARGHDRVQPVMTDFNECRSLRTMQTYNNEARERSKLFFPWFSRKNSLFMTGGTSIGCQKQKTKHHSVPGCLCGCGCLVCVCVIQHCNWPLRPTIINAHGTNGSPDGLCTRTHTNEAFSCWFCCNSFRVDRARRGEVCLEACLGRV